MTFSIPFFNFLIAGAFLDVEETLKRNFRTKKIKKSIKNHKKKKEKKTL